MQQIPNHFPPRHPSHLPRRRKIHRARQRIGIPKRKHARNEAYRVLERETRGFHLVLLDVAAAEMVHGSLRVDFGLERARGEGELGSLDDVEVIVGCVAACVAFGSDGCAEDYEVFCQAYSRVSWNFGSFRKGKMTYWRG